MMSEYALKYTQEENMEQYALAFFLLIALPKLHKSDVIMRAVTFWGQGRYIFYPRADVVFSLSFPFLFSTGTTPTD